MRQRKNLIIGAFIGSSCLLLILFILQNLISIPVIFIANIEIAICLILIFTSYLQKSRRFIFSSGFWLVINIFFYIILKSFFLDHGELQLYVQIELFIVFFLISYFIGSTFSIDSSSIANVITFPEFTPSKNKIFRLITIFFFFKLLTILLKVLLIRGEHTQLELAASTQNQGMAYVFNLGLVSSFAYYIILFVSYSHKQWKIHARILTIIIVLDYFMNANRLGLIVLILINIFLYDKYVKKVKLPYLALTAPLLIFIISFFGFVRNIEIGSIETYNSVFFQFLENSPLIIELFMHRLDMLPVMLKAYSQYETGNFELLYGKSYVYMFLHAIPRNIWTNKPLLSSALITSQVEPGLFNDGVNLYGSIVIEGLINWGIMGVIFSGFISGKLGRLLDEFKDSNNPYKILIYFVFFTYPMGLFNEGFHSNYFSMLIYQLFLVALTLLFINVRFKARKWL